MFTGLNIMNNKIRLIILHLLLLNCAPLFAFAPVVANNDSATIYSNSTAPITGDVTANDYGGNYVSLDSPSASQYGNLSLGVKGVYSYTLNTNAAAVLSLKQGQTLTDVFRYTYGQQGGITTHAQLSIQIIGNPSTPVTPVTPASPIANNDIATAVITYSTTQTSATQSSATVSITASPVTISVKDNDLNAASAPAYLVGDTIGQYGYFNGAISASGVLTYIVDTTNAKVTGLTAGQSLTDTFIYRLQVGSSPSASDPQATITIRIFSQQQGVTNQNVELKPNNSSKLATSLNTGQYMRGQLKTSVKTEMINSSEYNSHFDKGWFFLTSTGNEIIHLELCPQGTYCYNQKAWVMYVFDGDKLTDAIENQTFPLYKYIRETNKLAGATNHVDHMYLLYDQGLYGDALISVIDPCFGITNTLSFAAPALNPGQTSRNYYVAISSPLERRNTTSTSTPGTATCSSGSIILENTNTITSGTTLVQENISIFPANEDMYTFKVTHSGANPLLKASPDEVIYNSLTGIANIPKVRVNGQLYAATLQQGILSLAKFFDISNMHVLNETDFTNPYIGTYNPANNVVDLPKVTVEQTSASYSVKLLYHADTNTLELLTATPIQ